MSLLCPDFRQIRSSAVTEGPRYTMWQFSSGQVLHSWKNICKKACSKRITLKVIQGHRNCRAIRQAIHHFTLVVCSDNDYFALFPYFTIFTVYRTVCDLENVLHFQKDNWNYKPCVLSNSCVNITQIILYTLYFEVWELEGLKQQMWHSRSH